MLNIGSNEAINENNTLGGQAFTARPGLPKIVRAAAGHGAGARVRVDGLSICASLSSTRA